MMAAVGTMFFFSIIILFCVASQYPGRSIIGNELLDHSSFVLQYGLNNILHLPTRFVPSCLLLISTFASASGLCLHVNINYLRCLSQV